MPRARLSEAAVDQLREAVDTLVADRFPSPTEKTYKQEFVGQYIRDPHKQGPRTAALLRLPLADTRHGLLNAA